MTLSYDNCPIDPERQIRVLRVQPSSDANVTVRATLYAVSLDGPTVPVYNALSYCWGDPRNRNNIIVDGATVSVTFSLESALRRLRKEEEDFHIWADAVCINQNNTTEKEIQVPMMDKVYGKADMVIVWLGIARDDSDLAMDACMEWGGRTIARVRESQEDGVEMVEDPVCYTIRIAIEFEENR